MSERLSGKVAIITGAGRGIGAGVARRFAAEGARVVLATRSEAPGRETLEAIKTAGGEAVLDVVDVADRSAVSAMVQRTAERFGAIDIVLHNAALTSGTALGETPDDLLDRMFDLKVKCCFWLTRDALPWLKRSGSGRILLTSSGMGNRLVMPGRAAYAAACMAMTGFMRAAAIELAPDGITVNAVEPGFVPSQAALTHFPPAKIEALTAAIPTGRVGSTEDIAAAFAYLASNEAGHVTGQSIAVDGGLTLASLFGAVLQAPSPA